MYFHNFKAYRFYSSKLNAKLNWRYAIMISIIIILSCFNTNKIIAQDPSFTQFYQNPIYYNPALSGLNEGFTIRSNYRNFWRKLDKGFNIADISFDSQEPFLSGGIGLIAMSGIEGNGVINSQMIGFAYSYNLPVIPRRMELQMGLQGAWVQKRIRTDNLIFSDQLDAIYGVVGPTSYSTGGSNTISFPDFATGFNLRLNIGQLKRNSAATTLNLGFAMHHITQPNESFTGLNSKLPIKYVGYSSAIIKIESIFSNSIYLMPGLIFEKQANFENIMIGSNINFLPVIFGIWYRTNGDFSTPNNIKAITINAGVELGNKNNTNFRINYSYDINISRYQNLMGDAHEISLSLIIPDFQLFNNRKTLSKKVRQNRACYNKF